MVNQIVAAEHSAKALAEEGRQRQEQLRSGLEREAADLREEYMQRARHRVELVEQTEQAGAEETIAQTMAQLDRAGLLDDEAFAGAWAAARARRAVGPHRIAHELRQKGVDAQTASLALESVDGDEALAAAAALAARYLRRGGENVERRALAALQRRGYGYDDARRALEKAHAETQENELFPR